MIPGTFSDDCESFFEIELIANDRLELPVKALLDTGFSGWLAMDKQDIEELGWVYLYKQVMRMAQGKDTIFEIYAGKVKIGGEEFNIPVHIGTGVPELLIGRQWLRNMRLLADMPLGILTLG